MKTNASAENCTSKGKHVGLLKIFIIIETSRGHDFNKLI